MSAIDDKHPALGGPGRFLGRPGDEGAGSDLDALEAALAARCRTLEADPACLKASTAQTRFHWRPAAPLPGSPS